MNGKVRLENHQLLNKNMNEFDKLQKRVENARKMGRDSVSLSIAELELLITEFHALQLSQQSSAEITEIEIIGEPF